MLETVRKVMLIGLGAAVMSRDKIQQVMNDLVARGDVTKEEGKKLLDEFTSRAEEAGKNLNERIRTQIRRTLKDLGIADRNRIAALEARIAELERRLDEVTSSGPARSQAD